LGAEAEYGVRTGVRVFSRGGISKEVETPEGAVERLL
jgi:hypothetical protein